MKPFFTLLLACMISLSLAGQQDIKELKDLKKMSLSSKQFDGLSRPENRFDGNLFLASKYTLEKFRQLQKLPQKSASATTMQMDSLLLELYDTIGRASCRERV